MKPFAANLSDRYGGASIDLAKSGSAALVASLMACAPARIGEVIIPAICCPAVLTAVQFAGYTPILADVDPQSLQSSVANIRQAISDQTVAIIAVHMFGVPCDLTAIIKMARTNGIPVIEDACLSIGPFAGDDLPDATILSFGYDKPISIEGGGGAIVSYSDDITERLRKNLHQNKFLADFRGCQILANNHLNRLAEAKDERMRNVQQYLSGLHTTLIVFRSDASKHAWWRLSGLLASDRDALISMAKSRGIVFSAHYRSLGRFFTHGALAGADRIDAQIINLFVRPGTAPEEIDRNLEFLNGYLK